jgi:hypothetical protein
MSIEIASITLQRFGPSSSKKTSSVAVSFPSLPHTNLPVVWLETRVM